MKIRIVFVWIIYVFVSLGFDVCVAQAVTRNDAILVQDGHPENSAPKNFRTTASKLYRNRIDGDIDQRGLKQLQASGSAQFSYCNLNYILNNIQKYVPKDNIFIVDLRQESHGFVDGIPVSWYAGSNNVNQGKTSNEIQEQEKKLLCGLLTQTSFVVHQVQKSWRANVKSIAKSEISAPIEVSTEKVFVESHGVKSKRFYVLDRHRPSDGEVDAFIDFVRALPKDAWLHFHCRAGRGRTTVFMVMYDMLRNGRQVGFHDIVQRQIMLGGSSIDQTVLDEEDKWKEAAAQERFAFVQAFYDYALDPKGYTDGQSWRDYINAAQARPLRTAPSKVAG